MDGEEKIEMPTANDVVLKDIRDEIDDIINQPTSLPTASVNQVVTQSESATQYFAESFKEALTSLPTDPFVPLTAEAKNSLSIAGIDPYGLPPAQLYAKELSTTDYAFITGNTQTKVSIAIALAKQEQEGWESLAAQCNDRVQHWKIELADLERQRNLLQLSREGSLKFHSFMRGVASDVDRAQQDVDRGLANPIIARHLCKAQRQQYPPGSPSGYTGFAGTTGGHPGKQSPSAYPSYTSLLLSFINPKETA